MGVDITANVVIGSQINFDVLGDSELYEAAFDHIRLHGERLAIDWHNTDPMTGEGPVIIGQQLWQSGSSRSTDFDDHVTRITPSWFDHEQIAAVTQSLITASRQLKLPLNFFDAKKSWLYPVYVYCFLKYE